MIGVTKIYILDLIEKCVEGKCAATTSVTSPVDDDYIRGGGALLAY